MVEGPIPPQNFYKCNLPNAPISKNVWGEKKLTKNTIQ